MPTLVLTLLMRHPSVQPLAERLAQRPQKRSRDGARPCKDPPCGMKLEVDLYFSGAKLRENDDFGASVAEKAAKDLQY